MPYKDFTDRIWKISETKLPDLCKKDEGVVITGLPEAVRVACGGENFFGPGRYQSGKPEQIVAEKEYTIKLIVEDDTYTLEADLLGDRRIGGAWTAEDNTPPGPRKS
jgi:hypothetical protein